jgi:hypothetical protein
MWTSRRFTLKAHYQLDICLPQMRVAGGEFRDEF